MKAADGSLYTTLNRIKACGPCKDGLRTLLAHLGKTRADDEPLPYSVIVENNGLDDALWAMRAEPEHAREWRLYGVWCARQVQHLMKDKRSTDALDVAERYAKGQATDEELDAARAAAWAAARDAADAARDAARDAAWEAARVDAWAAAAAARDAADAAGAASAAARYAARNAAAAAGDAAMDAQRARFLEVVGGAS